MTSKVASADRVVAEVMLWHCLVGVAAALILFLGNGSALWLTINDLQEGFHGLAQVQENKAFDLALTNDVLLVGSEVALFAMRGRQGAWVFWVMFSGCATVTAVLNMWSFAHAHSTGEFVFWIDLLLGFLVALYSIGSTMGLSYLLKEVIVGYLLPPKKQGEAAGLKAGRGAIDRSERTSVPKKAEPADRWANLNISPEEAEKRRRQSEEAKARIKSGADKSLRVVKAAK